MKALIFTIAIFSLLMGAQVYIWLNAEPMIPESQATICPIDQFAKHIEDANAAYNEKNYIELKNSLDSMQELVDATLEEK